MKKSFLILPLLGLLLVGCGGSKDPTTPSTPGDGSLANPYTAEEALAEAKKLGLRENTTTEYYVTGNVVAGVDTHDKATPNVYKNRVSFHLEAGDESLLVYNANDADGNATFETSPVTVGDTVLVKGLLKNYDYNGTPVYQVCYVKDVGSCSLLDVNGVPTGGTTGGDTGGGTGGDTGGDTGGTGTISGGICGDNATNTGTVPSNAKTLTLDFSSGRISGIDATSSSSPQASGTATVSGYEFNFTNAIAHLATDHAAPGYLGLCTKTPKAVASWRNKTAIPGAIKKVEFTMPTGSGVSANAPFIIDFGTEALGATTNTGGQTGGSGVTLAAYPTKDCSYFAISCVQGMSSTGKASWYNGYISSIVITYVD